MSLVVFLCLLVFVGAIIIIVGASLRPTEWRAQQISMALALISGVMGTVARMVIPEGMVREVTAAGFTVMGLIWTALSLRELVRIRARRRS